MVFCTVTAFGKPMTAQLPVMNYMNKAIPNPDAFAVNTAMQRCLAKAIALHGIGLYIYAGEDIPTDGNGGHESQDDMVNTGVRVPSGFSKMTPEEKKERLGAGNEARMTGTGLFIFTPKQSIDTFKASFPEKEPNTPEIKPQEATTASNGVGLITHSEQLEIFRLAKEKKIHHLSLKKMLKDEFGVDGSAKLTKDQYPKVVEAIIRFEVGE